MIQITFIKNHSAAVWREWIREGARPSCSLMHRRESMVGCQGEVKRPGDAHLGG